jgi:hypothetical protein
MGNSNELRTMVNNEDRNACHLIIKGNRFQHIFNGILVGEVLDEDIVIRKMSRLLSVRVHVDPPMKVEYRNFRI